MASLDQRVTALEDQRDPAEMQQVPIDPAQLDAHFAKALGYEPQSPEMADLCARIERAGVAGLTLVELRAVASIKLSDEDQAPFSAAR